MWLVEAGAVSLCGVPVESFRHSHEPDIHVGPNDGVHFLHSLGSTRLRLLFKFYSLHSLASLLRPRTALPGMSFPMKKSAPSLHDDLLIEFYPVYLMPVLIHPQRHHAS
jgi:hypothetical protein